MFRERSAGKRLLDGTGKEERCRVNDTVHTGELPGDPKSESFAWTDSSF